MSAPIYTQGFGSAPISKIALIPFVSNAAPASTNLVGPNGPWQIGQQWIVSSTNTIYELTSITSSGGVMSANWQELSTSSGGILPVPGGGTGAASFTAHGVLLGEGTSAIAASSAGTSGQVFTSGGASADGAYATLGTNSNLSGLVLGNNNSAFTAAAYVPITAWSPSLSIGGSTAGITYGATPTGFWQQVGNMVFFTITLALSSKGSNSGQVSINNMPIIFGSNGSINNISVAEFANITLTTNYTAIGATGSAASTNLVFDQIGSGQALTTLTATQMANNSSLFISGFYFTN